MELDESLASDTPRRTELSRSRAHGELERAAQPVVAGDLVAATTHDLHQPLTAIELTAPPETGTAPKPVRSWSSISASGGKDRASTTGDSHWLGPSRTRMAQQSHSRAMQPPG